MSYLVDVSKVARKGLQGKKDENGEWTYDTKITVAELLLSTQNMRVASEMTGVPYDTIKDWRKEDYWPQVLEEVHKMRRAELNTRLSKIVDSALTKIEDRLENGDYVLNNKTGEIMRKPVSLKDANQVAKDILGQQISLRKAEKDSVEIQTSVKDILSQLATEFSKLNRKIKQNNATDVVFVEKE